MSALRLRGKHSRRMILRVIKGLEADSLHRNAEAEWLDSCAEGYSPKLRKSVRRQALDERAESALLADLAAALRAEGGKR